MNKSHLIKKVASVSIIIIIAKVLGFIKQVLTASYFGATIQTDLIYLSEGLVSNIDYLLVQALSTAFIPTYVAISIDQPEKRKRFVAHTICFFLVTTLIIAGILFFIDTSILTDFPYKVF